MKLTPNIDHRTIEAPDGDYGQDEQNSELVERAKMLLHDRLMRNIDETLVLIIAMVENDMAARLLSDGAVVAAFKSQSSGMPGDFELRSLRTKQMAALDHIGITGEDTDE